MWALCVHLSVCILASCIFVEISIFVLMKINSCAAYCRHKFPYTHIWCTGKLMPVSKVGCYRNSSQRSMAARSGVCINVVESILTV